MAESKRRPRSLKGAVLIMVVTILFVLIVMLLATLAVVSSTQQRTFTKYEETQAYYTARSVLEVYINEFLQGKDDYQSAAEINHLEKAMEAGGFLEIAQKDSSGNMKKGFQKMPNNVYYTFSYDSKKPAENHVDIGFAHQQEIFGYLTPKYGWKPKAGTSYENDQYDSRNWVEVNDKQIGDKYFVEFEADVPELSAVGKSNEFDSDGKVTVRVELLRVLYRTKDETTGDSIILSDCVGGLDTNASSVTKANGYEYAATGAGATAHGDLSTGHADDATDAQKAKKNIVNWKDTYYRIKVTATANLSDSGDKTDPGSEISVSVLLEPNPIIKTSEGNQNAMTSFAQATPVQKLMTIGGSSANAPGTTLLFKNAETTLAGSYVFRNNVEFNSSSCGERLYIPMTEKSSTEVKGESFVVQGGTLILSGDGSGHIQGNGPAEITDDTTKLSKRPFIYASGLIANAGNQALGRKDAAIDLLVSAWDADDGYDPANPNCSPGKILGASSGISFDRSGSKLSFYSTANNNGLHIFGNVYVDGDIVLSDKTFIHGNLYCTGNVYTPGSVTHDPPFSWETPGGTPTELSGLVDGKIVAAGAGFLNRVEAGDWSGKVLSMDYQTLDSASGADLTYLNKLTKSGTSASRYSATSDAWSIRTKTNFDNGDATVDVTLPGGVVRTIRSVNDIKSTYTYADNPDACSALGLTPPSGKTVNDPMTAEDWFKKTLSNKNLKLEVSSSAPELNEKISGEKELANGKKAQLIKAKDCLKDTSTGLTEFYQASIDFTKNGATNWTRTKQLYYIDTDGGNLQIQLKGTNDAIQALFIVGGSGKVFFTNKGDDFSGKLNVYTEDVYDLFFATAQDGGFKPDDTVEGLSLGDYPKDASPALHTAKSKTYYKTIKAPNIYYFIGGEGKMFRTYNANNSKIIGYFYSPYNTFHANAQPGGPKLEYAYNGQEVEKYTGSAADEANGDPYTVTDIQFIGSLVTGKYTSDNDIGCIYINPGSDTGGASGGAGGNINWGRQRYLNS